MRRSEFESLSGFPLEFTRLCDYECTAYKLKRGDTFIGVRKIGAVVLCDKEKPHHFENIEKNSNNQGERCGQNEAADRATIQYQTLTS